MLSLVGLFFCCLPDNPIGFSDDSFHFDGSDFLFALLRPVFVVREEQRALVAFDGEIEVDGFHENIDEILESPQVHPNCCCYRIPIFEI